MYTRDKLIDYLNNKKFINARLEELERRREILNKLSATYSITTSKTAPEYNDSIAEKIVNLIEITENTVRILNDMQKDLIGIEEQLQKMQNTLYRNILYSKYIEGKELNEISVEIERDYKYTIKLHGYALNEFDKMKEDE